MGQRVQLVKTKDLCINCLRPGHFVDNCSTPRRCKHDGCGRKHHTLLHSAPSITDATTTVKIASPLCAAIRANSATVYLQIARVKVYAPNGKTTNTYALLDNGSQTTLIRQDVADRLQLSGFPDTLTLGTVNGESVLRSTQRVKFKVGPTGSTGTYDVPWAWTVPRLGVPAQKIGDKIHNTTFEHLDGLTFPNVKSQEIGLLLGANVPEAIVAVEIKRGSPGNPVAVKTPLGWTLMGVADGSARCSRLPESLIASRLSRRATNCFTVW